MARKIEFEIDEELGCFNCTSHKPNKDGYRQVAVNNTLYIMHRFIYEQCFGEIPTGYIVRHKCDNTHCINPAHLEVGTPADNMNDKMIRGRHRSPVGEDHGRSKLTEKEVYNLLKDVKFSNLTIGQIAKKYSINKRNVFRIKKGELWGHLHLRYSVLIDVENERIRQDEMWSIQRHSLGDWLKILVEEVGEVAQAMQKEKDWGKDSDAGNLYEELIHTAAVAVAIAEQVKEKRDSF